MPAFKPPRIEFASKLPSRADVVVVGGGVAGLAVAYSLARIGYPGSIVVLEKGFLGSGSSVRNAARFRVHFFSKENTVFAIESARRIERLPWETGVNVAVKRGGYLWLLEREESLEVFRKFNRELWAPLGVPVEVYEPSMLGEKYPQLRLENIAVGVFGPQNGSVHYYQMLLALAHYAASHGARIALHRRVKKVVVEAGRIKGVEVEGAGTIESRTVVVAAGSWSRELLERSGITPPPLKPTRKSLLVTEPYKYTLDPLVILFEKGSYIGQTFKGGIIATGVVKDPETLDHSRISLEWFKATIKTIRRLLKGAEGIRVIRAWSGTYNITPDHSHVLGRSSEWPEGLYVSTGYSGHGLMMSLYAGELLAKLIVEDKIHPHMKPYLPDRFREGRLIRETLILG